MSRLATLFLALAILGAIACSGVTSTTVTPTTGILVRAETLTSGRGCGVGPTNLFKYAVVVFGYEAGNELDPSSYSKRITSNLFDYYTDGTFIDLAASGGNSRYRLEVYAWNEPAYAAARDLIDSAGTNTTQLREQTAPTWTTECTATQQREVQALALCAPLAPGLTGVGGTQGPTRITLATTSFRLSDGRVATCRTAPAPDGGATPDGGTGPDASDDGGTDGGEPLDAGAPVSFTTARVRFRVGHAFVGDPVDVACPTVYSVDVPAEPARYDIDVGLLDGTTPVGLSSCHATSLTGATSSAVCP